MQPGSLGIGGGHVTGGAMSGLFHMDLGPVLTASMTHYEMIEIANQQQYRREPHMPLTARIEYTVGNATYTSTEDFNAVLTATRQNGQVAFNAHGKMLDNYHRSPKRGELSYQLTYTLSDRGVEMTATLSGEIAGSGNPSLIVPVVSRSSEALDRPDKQTVRIVKSSGALTVRTDASTGFEAVATGRTFNLVPGVEAIPLKVPLEPGKTVGVRFEADLRRRS